MDNFAPSTCLYPDHADRRLWELVCSGDLGAIEALLVDQCGSALRYLANKYSYPDLLSHLYLHLRENDWARLRTWAGRSSLKTWVEQVAIRLCLAQMKEMRRFQPLDMCLPALEVQDAAMHWNTVEHQVLMTEVLSAIERLENSRERVLLRLHIVQHIDLADVAKMLGITRQNADTTKHRAIRRLAAMLNMTVRHAY